MHKNVVKTNIRNKNNYFKIFVCEKICETKILMLSLNILYVTKTTSRYHRLPHF